MAQEGAKPPLTGSGERNTGTRRHEKPGGGTGSQPAATAPGGAPKAKGLLSRATPLDAMIALVVIGIAVTYGLPMHWESARRANEQAALAFTREVPQLQATYRSQKGGGARFAAGFFAAAAGIYTGPAPEGGLVTRDGYLFKITPLDGESTRWYATALPAIYGGTGDRSYYVDDTGKVRVSEGPIVGPAFPEAQ